MTIAAMGFQSTHPARGATVETVLKFKVFEFQSTHPARGATCSAVHPYCLSLLRFQSTHPARGATMEPTRLMVRASISIHAPREGCDVGCFNQIQPMSDFNPRTPRGVRHKSSFPTSVSHSFQSTHPARGATSGGCLVNADIFISIHAPREGCDLNGVSHKKFDWRFQSTHPARGATCEFHVVIQHRHRISIHAPREGCD